MTGFGQFAEMPLRKMDLVPPHDPANPDSAWSPTAKKKYGWSVRDTKLLTNERGLQKFTKLFDNTRVPFEFYLVRSQQGWKVTRNNLFTGERSVEWVNENLPQLAPFAPCDDCITVIYTSNQSGNNVPFTAWMAAHRLGHAIDRNPAVSQTWKQLLEKLDELTLEVLTKYYRYKRPPGLQYRYGGDYKDRDKEEKLKRSLLMNIGTMRSTRHRTLDSTREFRYELLAQYLTTKSKVQFDREMKPLIQRYMWGRPDGQYATGDFIEFESDIDYFADLCNDYLDEVMNECLGKIFVA